LRDASVFGVQDLVTIAGDNHETMKRTKLVAPEWQNLSQVIEMVEVDS